ncbi:LysR substrate-binding domain-containing protein [Streptomyces sp. NRRL S-1022]|uniref:LysR substrate-binding domain-containing protein n=1 Tax=Streptomyces sp. NRRL S-1022 TaxID=1463880 RepID=UPI002D21E4C2|nr:LysR substrate-binding domain-containing protein [Streptomyces sp. NRRL S-1022]
MPAPTNDLDLAASPNARFAHNLVSRGLAGGPSRRNTPAPAGRTGRRPGRTAAGRLRGRVAHPAPLLAQEFGRRPANPAALVAPDLRAVLAALEAGAGISALPRYLAEPALSEGRIALLHRPVAPPLNTVYLAVRRGAPANPALTVVRERLTDAAARWGGLMTGCGGVACVTA